MRFPNPATLLAAATICVSTSWFLAACVSEPTVPIVERPVAADPEDPIFEPHTHVVCNAALPCLFDYAVDTASLDSGRKAYALGWAKRWSGFRFARMDFSLLADSQLVFNHAPDSGHRVVRERLRIYGANVTWSGRATDLPRASQIEIRTMHGDSLFMLFAQFGETHLEAIRVQGDVVLAGYAEPKLFSCGTIQTGGSVIVSPN